MRRTRRISLEPQFWHPSKGMIPKCPQLLQKSIGKLNAIYPASASQASLTRVSTDSMLPTGEAPNSKYKICVTYILSY